MMFRPLAPRSIPWAARDRQPQITRQGKPSAFSVELVGKYSAFEEIDLADYLAVRERAVRMVAELTNCDYDAARARLEASGWDLRAVLDK